MSRLSKFHTPKEFYSHKTTTKPSPRLKDRIKARRNKFYTPKNFYNHKSASEFHIGLEIPKDVAKKIHDWVKEQDWPEGTELEAPNDYHITLVYAEDGHEDHAEDEWRHAETGYDAEVAGIDLFGDEDRKATVLKIKSPDVVRHAEDVMDVAEERGIEINKFPGGYKPHITVAYGPGKPLGRSLKLQFKTGPSSVSEPREKTAVLDAKTAMAVPLYHLAPTAARENIQQNGLMGHDMTAVKSPWNQDVGQPHGNYFFDHPDAAEGYAYTAHDALGARNRDHTKGEYPGDNPDQFADHGVYNGTIESYNEDEDDYDEEPYDHMNSEHRAMLPSHLQGYDVWHVPEHALQGIQRDPENHLVGRPKEWSDQEHLTPEQAEMTTRRFQEEHDDPNYHGQGPLRYFTPEHVPAHKLSLHSHLPAWEMTQDDMMDRIDDTDQDSEYPEPYHHVPINDWNAYKPPSRSWEFEHAASKVAAEAWSVDQRAIDKAGYHLGLKNPVKVNIEGGTYGQYQGLQNGTHIIKAIGWLRPVTANEQIWHEMIHAKQAEDGVEFPERPESYDDYRAQPHEQEAHDFKPPWNVVLKSQIKGATNDQAAIPRSNEWNFV